MTARFTGKAVLVTGGGSGLGRATAHAFAREGAQVMVAGRTAGPLAETVKSIEAEGGTAAAVTADVSDADDAVRMVAATVERFGGLDVAFNNAGVVAAGPLAELAEDAWRRQLDINVTGTFLSMRAEIAHMRAHGGGVIVNTSSNIGPHRRLPGLGGYGVSKAAVSALTKAAALEHIGDGIRVNVVSPGPLDTPMSMRPGETEADRAARMKTTSPIGRVGSLVEAAATVLWLASADAGYAVGHDFVLDGGASL